MTKKEQKTDPQNEGKQQIITVKADDSEMTPGRMAAKVSLSGFLNPTMLMTDIVQIDGLKPGAQDWMEELINTRDEIKNGETKRIEGMLIGQMYALDAIFTNLVRKAINAQFMPQLEAYMRLALKAQNQSRATADTLVQIRRPRHTIIAQQANIAEGPQQVNNTINQSAKIKRRKGQDFQKNSESEQNKLLTADEKGEWLDTGTAGKAGCGHPELETVGTVNRAKNSRRKSGSSAKRL